MATAKSNAKVKAEATVETAAPAEAVATETPQVSFRLVVCAYPGTGEQLAKVWLKMTGEEPLVMIVQRDASLTDTLAEAVANPEIADTFILVPANCVPCAPISLDELKGPFVFVDVGGTRHYCDRLPVFFSKEALVEVLTSSPEDDETLMKTYYKNNLHRPIEGGFRIGNLVTPVYRANPCENLVIEAFVRKKFVTASPEGYKAIARLVDQYLLG